MDNIKVGYHCITWWSEKDKNFLKSLDEISEAGYKGFETGLFLIDDYYGKESELKEIIGERNLELVTLYGGGGFIDPDKYDEEMKYNIRGIEFLARMDCSYLVVGGGTKRAEGNSEEDYQVLATALNELGRRCKDYGLKACYHLHWNTMVETREQLTRICDMTDPGLVYLVPDTAHLARGGSDPVEVFRAYMDRTIYTHFKDIDMRQVEADQKKGDYQSMITYFLELGEGKMEFPAIVDIMKQADYKGWIMVELDSTRRTPKESALISKRYLEEKLGLKA